MIDEDRQPPRLSLDEPRLAWTRAAREAHASERRLRQFVAEMHALADGLVLRMAIVAHLRPTDPVMSRAIELRERLGAEARVRPVLYSWQRDFEALDEMDAEFAAELDRYLEPCFEARRLNEEQRDRYRFRSRATKRTTES